MIRIAMAAAVIGAGFSGLGAARAEQPPPAAVFRDPPVDARHPASGEGVQFESHGVLVNAQLYRPAGEGSHPTVVLLHGLPGNEQNLDLGRAMQRAGWTVITFHYRGAWGSGGAFTLKGGVEDATALLAQLRQPDKARAWGVDPARIVLMGHSYGGFVAARALASAPAAMGVALIAPWDPSMDLPELAKLSQAGIDKFVAENFNDIDGRLTGATGASLAHDIVREGASLDLARTVPMLAGRPLLVLTATRDSADDQADALVAELKARPGVRLTTERMDTDHGFNDHRIALEVAVLSWLAALPGAP